MIANHPRLDDGSPFPTTYWLVCPVLLKRMSRIESQGWMSQINEALEEDHGMGARLAGAIDAYRADRDSLEEIEESGGPPGGGPERVKCLHAHAAHQLVSQINPVGALALADVGWPDCREPCFEAVSK